MTAGAIFSILCHTGVLLSRIVLAGAFASALVLSRPARISFLSRLPEKLQPAVADLFNTGWAVAIVTALGGVGAISRYLPDWLSLSVTAFNCGVSLGVALHVVRLVTRLPRYIRGLA